MWLWLARWRVRRNREVSWTEPSSQMALLEIKKGILIFILEQYVNSVCVERFRIKINVSSRI